MVRVRARSVAHRGGGAQRAEVRPSVSALGAPHTHQSKEVNGRKAAEPLGRFGGGRTQFFLTCGAPASFKRMLGGSHYQLSAG